MKNTNKELKDSFVGLLRYAFFVITKKMSELELRYQTEKKEKITGKK